ncbi:MAG: DUF6044 family protein [Lachnospiraceae bacterium]|nr:DUF6044 family protein [Lachnospiraceae bacterium]
MLTKKSQKRDVLVFAMGCVAVAAALLPYIILGENMVVFYSDQLDGEVLAYMLHAKYLFTGTDTYPELMNGISANGLFPPAPLSVLLYRIMHPAAAFVCNQIFCMLAAYAGMYLCLKGLIGNAWISAFCGILFAYLPLLSVYGLCQYGLPLLFYAFYLLYEGRHKALALGVVALYGFMSSLVLVGYAVLGIGGLGLLWLLWKRRGRERRWAFIGWGTLLCSYLLVNYKLILQVFGIGEHRASHKEIIVRYGQQFTEAFKNVFYAGTVHTPTHQQVIVLFTVAVLALGALGRRRLGKQERTILLLAAGGVCFNLCCALFYAFYQSGFMAELRNRAGGIFKEFQLDRVYWLTVPVWYLLLGLDLYLLWGWVRRCGRSRRRGLAAIGAVGLLGLACLSAATVYYYSDMNKNLHRLRQGEAYERITWDDFYAPETFAQIDDFIGRDKASYRTLSFGIYPAAPLYNGFYCLDGYSNNYDLSYLYTFREIIAGELEKSDSLRKYYDEWGCRCYVLSAELGIDRYMLSKNGSPLSGGLSLDTGAAARLGAEYLFSAIEIPNAEELGLTLLREEPFGTPDSFYEIYLYGLPTE